MKSNIIYLDNDYRIVKTSRDYILANINGEYDNHGHFACEEDCYKMIDLINKKRVPKGPYKREAAMRISTDIKYINKVLNKIEKDKQKLRFFKVNNGCKR